MSDELTANLRVVSSLLDETKHVFLAPERFRACGVLGELAEQGGPPAPVRVPFSERALGVWSADESVKLATVRQEVAAYVEVLEVCDFLKLDFPQLQDAIYMCALRCALVGEGRYVPQSQRKRLRSTPPEVAAIQYGAEYVLDWLQRKPGMAEAVLTAPRAHESRTPLSLAQVYDALPDALHAAAARGFFGAGATEWRLDATRAPALRASMRTLQLLAHQLNVVDVRLTDDGLGLQALQALFVSLARAQHLTAFCIQRPPMCHGYGAPCPWLRQLAAMTKLQRLELCGCRLAEQSLPHVAALLPLLPRLTALVLEGSYGIYGLVSDIAAAQLGTALLALQALSSLGLPGVTIARPGMHALGSALAGLPRLRSLALGRTVTFLTPPQDVVMFGVAACTALTKLDLSECELRAGYDSVRELCGLRACLHDLTLNFNKRLGSDGARDILAAPTLRSLTRLCLVNVGITAGPWPWRQVCELTALQELRLDGNHFADAGAAAFAAHVAALAQLRRLDISDCGLTVAGPLAHALWRLPRLQELACEQRNAMEEPLEIPAAARARGLELVSSFE